MTETAVREITGIERLRALGREQEERSWSMVGKVRGRLMLQIADQIERELTEALDGRGEEVTDVATVRADAMEAYGWARERGGLDAVRRALQDAENRRAELCSALGVDAGTGWSDAMEEVRTRVRRPAPKVLDADGAEIRVWDVLYSVETGDYVIVDSIEPGNPWFATTDGTLQHCAKFTHRAPVLAADGKPLREGETVWKRTNGEKLTVMRLVTSVVGLVGCSDGTEAFGMPVIFNYCPSDLTHERPDSFEQLEKDANDLIYDIGFHLGDYSPSDFKEKGDSVQDRVRDLVRRAKALAGRDAK